MATNNSVSEAFRNTYSNRRRVGSAAPDLEALEVGTIPAVTGRYELTFNRSLTRVERRKLLQFFAYVKPDGNGGFFLEALHKAHAAQRLAVVASELGASVADQPDVQDNPTPRQIVSVIEVTHYSNVWAYFGRKVTSIRDGSRYDLPPRHDMRFYPQVVKFTMTTNRGEFVHAYAVRDERYVTGFCGVRPMWVVIGDLAPRCVDGNLWAALRSYRAALAEVG